MRVYDWLIMVAGSEDARCVQLDLAARKLMFKDDLLIDNGELVASSVQMPDGSTATFTGIMDYDGEHYAEVERLYAIFKRSVPGKHERLNKGNFKALSSDSLSYSELESSISRTEARILLEGFILCAASAKLMPWANPAHFYWQGADPDLILYREWII